MSFDSNQENDECYFNESKGMIRGTESCMHAWLILYNCYIAVSLINDSPRVEGNNVTVDLRTDYPVQCSIKLAATSTPLRDCESMNFVLYAFS